MEAKAELRGGDFWPTRSLTELFYNHYAIQRLSPKCESFWGRSGGRTGRSLLPTQCTMRFGNVESGKWIEHVTLRLEVDRDSTTNLPILRKGRSQRWGLKKEIEFESVEK